MATPLDVIAKTKKIYLPKEISLAVNLIEAFVKNNNPLGLKIAILLSGARHQIQYDEDNGVTFVVNDLCQVCHVDRTYLKNNIQSATKTFFKYVDLQGNTGGTHPLHSYQYFNNNKHIRIEISSKAKQLFSELKSKKNSDGYQYTKAISRNLMIYDLKDINKHTIKMQLLLEMISHFSSLKRKIFSLEELNGFFGTHYARYGDLDRMILRPVRNDTLKYSSLSFDYTPQIIDRTTKKIGEVAIEVKDNLHLFSI